MPDLLVGPRRMIKMPCAKMFTRAKYFQCDARLITSSHVLSSAEVRSLLVALAADDTMPPYGLAFLAY